MRSYKAKRFKVLELIPSCMNKKYHITHFTLLPIHYTDSIIIKIHLLMSPNYIVKWWAHNLRSTGTPISDIQIELSFMSPSDVFSCKRKKKISLNFLRKTIKFERICILMDQHKHVSQIIACDFNSSISISN